MAEDDTGDLPGLLPPDGVAWPPEPVAAPAAPMAPDSLPTTARRPDDADIQDWRTMAIDAPDGYRGSATAPPVPTAQLELWSITAFGLAVLAALPWLWPYPLLPPLAVAFGLAGRRACTLDPTKQGKAFATVGICIALATLAFVVTRVARGSLTLFSL